MYEGGGVTTTRRLDINECEGERAGAKMGSCQHICVRVDAKWVGATIETSKRNDTFSNQMPASDWLCVELISL